MATERIAIMVVLFGSFIGAAGQYYFKKGANKIYPFTIRKICNRSILLAIILYVLGAVTYLLVLPKGELSVLYPLVATNFVWVVIIARIKFREQINIWKILGLLGILLGVVMISLSA